MSRFYKDGMFGLIVGDAVGMPVQFEERSERKLDPVKDMREHLCFDMPKGAWTDDSSLALATLFSIKEQGKLDIENVAKNFAMWLVDGLFTPLGFAYDVGTGCMNAIYRFIQTMDAYNCGGKSEQDNGNGSLMRILPTCIYAYEELIAGNITENEAITLVEASSAITHAHKRAQTACVIYFYITKEILDNRNVNGEKTFFELIESAIAKTRSYALIHIDTFKEYSKFHRLFALRAFRNLPEDEILSSGYVLHSLEAALWSIINTDNYRDCILKAVNLGGDTDSIAAIAGGLAGLFYGYDSIPKDWVDAIMRREWIEELCDFNCPIISKEDRIMIDCHGHYIPGIDDGAKDIVMATRMLEIARNNGIKKIICTPHSWAILESEDSDTVGIFNDFKSEVNKTVPEIPVHLGCEVLFDLDVKKETIDSVRESYFPAYESGKCVLIELYNDPTEDEVLNIVRYVKDNGYTPVLAHLERYPELFPCDNFYKRIDDSTVKKIIEAGALIQINVTSIDTVIDKEWNSIARFLLFNKYAHFLGTDAHNDYRRTPEVADDLSYIYTMCDKEYAEAVCYKNALKYLINSN